MLNNLLLGQTAEEKLYVEDVFSTYLYTGNGSTQTITNGIDLAGKGGLVWVKARNIALPNYLIDTDRGGNKILRSESTSGNSNQTNPSIIFNNNGFSLDDSAGASVNYAGSPASTYASWTFRKAPKFFTICTYTGTGSVQSITHDLGVAPGLIIIKRTDGPSDWSVFHHSSGSGKVLFFNTTAAEVTSSSYWNNTNPTSTQFTLGSGGANNNSGQTYVAYLFAHDTTADGVIQCGSFTKDGSSNASVTLGWEPQYVLVKSTNGTGSAVGDSWLIADIMRGASESLTNYLRANTSDADATNGGPWCVPTATGFKIQGLSGGSNHIYLAIRRGPMRVPTDATKVFCPNASSSSQGTKVTTNFPIDTQLMVYRPGDGGNSSFADRLRGISTTSTGLGVRLISSSTNAESTSTLITQFWDNTGFQISENYSGASTIYWNFRRAPGFFDVVCYTGTGATLSVNHNLGVTPELLILKRRNSTGGWPVWRTATGTGSTFGYLNDNGAEADQGVNILTASPTASSFSVGAWGPINASGGTYVAYLFATCAGVSKIGTYTGTGTTKQIDCGFTNGARFVLIKRTDSTGDWTVWDTARGIVSGNDPYLLLNSTAAEVTNTDYIDPLSTGFEISSTAPAAINANGGTFIYLAIA